MLVSGWGNYPKVDADVYTIEKFQDLICYTQNKRFNNNKAMQGAMVTSALNKNIISTLKFNRFLISIQKMELLLHNRRLIFGNFKDFCSKGGSYLSPLAQNMSRLAVLWHPMSTAKSP
jgi:hypothetical protein